MCLISARPVWMDMSQRNWDNDNRSVCLVQKLCREGMHCQEGWSVVRETFIEEMREEEASSLLLEEKERKVISGRENVPRAMPKR